MLFWLGFLGIIGPMAIDVYLPALPQMGEAFGVPASMVQLGLSTTTIGMAIGTFAIGLLSDRWGRRAPLVITGWLMVAGCLLAALSPNLIWFLCTAFLMGFGASSVQTAARGVIADLTHGPDAIRAFSQFTSIMMLGPIFGPVGGVLLLTFTGWQGIFVALAIFTGIGTVGVMFTVRESLTIERRHTHGFGETVRVMGKMWTEPVYRWFSIVMFTSYALMFSYLGTCSLTIQVQLGQPAWVAALALAINGGTIVLTAWIAGQLAKRLHGVTITLISYTGVLLGILFLGFSLATNNVNVIAIFVVYFLVAGFLGMGFGPITSLSITHMKHASGTALGQMGLFQFIVAAVVSTLVGTISPNPAESMLVLGAISLLIAYIGTLLGKRALAKNPGSDLPA